jgi:conjugal transfer pilus assembly protein TraB
MNLESLRKRFGALKSGTRAALIKVGIIGGVLLVCLIGYYATGQREKKPPPPKQKFAVIQLGDSRLEDDIRSQVEREREEQRNKNKEQDSKLKADEEQLKAEGAQLEAMQKVLQALGKGADANLDGSDVIVSDAGQKGSGPKGLAISAKDSVRNRPPMDPAVWQKAAPDGEKLQAKLEFVGDIGTLTPPPGVKENAEKGGKKNRRFYLPVSFMPAKLLTGLKAKTVDSAKSDPEPVLLRVQAPAVLPNEVRAQLEGCFVVAHGYGSLASEAFEARTVSLSCVDYAGRSVIEADITGYLADKDGSNGLTGLPVSKMGANLARLFLAGLVQGAGNAFQQSASTISVSPLGATQTVDSGQVERAGLGRGISQASGELTRVYVDLVRQASPVIEVGPGKDVTVVIIQGVWLEVKDYET